MIDITVKAGISPSVVDGLDSPRPKPLLQAAIFRFRENQRVRKQSPTPASALEILYRATPPAVLLSDRIVMMTNGPRDRISMSESKEYNHYRHVNK